MKITRNTIILAGVMLVACLAVLAGKSLQEKRVENYLHAQLKNVGLKDSEQKLLNDYVIFRRTNDSLAVREYTRSRRADLKYLPNTLFLLGLYQRFSGSDSAEANLRLVVSIAFLLLG